MKAKLVAVFATALLMGAAVSAQTSNPPVNATPTVDKSIEKTLRALQDSLAETQQRMADQQQQIEMLKSQLATVQNVDTNSSGTPALIDAAMPGGSASATSIGAINPNTGPNGQYNEQGKANESPLSFKIGGADFTPGGFMDFTSIFRSTNTGNAGGTNFFAIPFSNTVTGHLTETRF